MFQAFIDGVRKSGFETKSCFVGGAVTAAGVCLFLSRPSRWPLLKLWSVWEEEDKSQPRRQECRHTGFELSIKAGGTIGKPHKDYRAKFKHASDKTYTYLDRQG